MTMVSEAKPSSQKVPAVLRWIAGLFRYSMKIVLLAAFVAGGLFVGGFLKFSNAVESYQIPETVEPADGVVALTGGSERIAHALMLVAEKKGKRLLISGVNPDTKITDIAKLNAKRQAVFDCCVDVESRALNTVGNAEETSKWVKKNGYKSLIIVTSGYHMPRSMMEFRRQMPDVKLTSYPVQLKEMQDENWWRDHETLRLMLSAYVKYLGAWSRDYLDAKTIATLHAGMWGG